MLALLLVIPLLSLPLLRPHNSCHAAVMAHKPVRIVALIVLQSLLLIRAVYNVLNDIPVLIRLCEKSKEPFLWGRRGLQHGSCPRWRLAVGGRRRGKWRKRRRRRRRRCCGRVWWTAAEQAREPTFDAVQDPTATIACWGRGSRGRAGGVVGEDLEEADVEADLLGNVDDVDKGGDGGQEGQAVQEALGGEV